MIGGELFPQNPTEVRTKMVGWGKRYPNKSPTNDMKWCTRAVGIFNTTENLLRFITIN